MPDNRGHLRVSRIIMARLGMEILGLNFQKQMPHCPKCGVIDRDPSLPQHREWDHTSVRFLAAKDDREIAEWVIHLAADYNLISEWSSIAQGMRETKQ
jgi:hypothetical protein